MTQTTAKMTNDEILDLLSQYTYWLTEDERKRFNELLNELKDRLCTPEITVSFAMSGSAETVGTAVAEMLIRSASPEDVQELRSQIMEAMR